MRSGILLVFAAALAASGCREPAPSPDANDGGLRPHPADAAPMGSDAGASADRAAGAALAWVERFREDTGLAPDAEQVLYRYPRTLSPGAALRDYAGGRDIPIDAPVELFWFDPAPLVRFGHVTHLLLVDPAGAVQTMVELQGWPVVEGGTLWGRDVLDIPAADVVLDPAGTREPGYEPRPDITRDHAASAPEGELLTAAAGSTLAGAGECVPRRHVLLVRGPPGSAQASMDEESASVREVMGLPGLGVTRFAEYEIASAPPAERKRRLRERIDLLLGQLQCCDEVILFYIGHGQPSPGHPRFNGAWILSDVPGEGGADPADLYEGAALGEQLRLAINGGRGCKFLVFSDSCFSAGFTEGMMSRLGHVGDRYALSHGTVDIGHAAQADEPAYAAFVGVALLRALASAAMGRDEPLAFYSLRTLFHGAIRGLTVYHVPPYPFIDRPKNQAGVTTAWGRNPDACCPRCGDGNVDPGEQCDPPGSRCDDGDACTGGDRCTAECRCLGDPMGCDGPPPCHSSAGAYCDAGGCVYPSITPGAACEADGDACTTGTCDAGGRCVEGASQCCSTDAECADGNPCTSDRCQDRRCAHEALPQGSACDDGDGCTIGDTCDSSAHCRAGSPRDCNDGNSCTSDACAGGACIHQPENGAPCDDGDACTRVDACVGGQCVGSSPVSCAPPASACQLPGRCSPATGQCIYPAAPDGTACSDADACTTGDQCAGGICRGSGAACPTAGRCQQGGGCDGATGQCVPVTAVPDGTACDDADGCTMGDVCSGGQCAGTRSQCCVDAECADRWVCTTNTCDGATHTCEAPVITIPAGSGGAITYPDGAPGNLPGTFMPDRAEILLTDDTLEHSVIMQSGTSLPQTADPAADWQAAGIWLVLFDPAHPAPGSNQLPTGFAHDAFRGANRVLATAVSTSLPAGWQVQGWSWDERAGWVGFNQGLTVAVTGNRATLTVPSSALAWDPCAARFKIVVAYRPVGANPVLRFITAAGSDPLGDPIGLGQ